MERGRLFALLFLFSRKINHPHAGVSPKFGSAQFRELSHHTGMSFMSRQTKRPLPGALWLLLGLGACQMAKAETHVDFARDIRPIFNKNCVGCHGGVKRAGKISFIYREVVVATNAAHEKPIHPGDPEHSE